MRGPGPAPDGRAPAPRSAQAFPGVGRDRLTLVGDATSRSSPPGRGERREYHGGAQVMAAGPVESAAARYQVQGRVVGAAVNCPGWEIGFGVLAYGGNTEYRDDPVGQRHVDVISRPEA